MKKSGEFSRKNQKKHCNLIVFALEKRYAGRSDILLLEGKELPATNRSKQCYIAESPRSSLRMRMASSM
jgi:hypothetical protein